MPKVAYAESYLGLCFPLIHSIVFNDSGSRQQRPRSDCMNAVSSGPFLTAHALKAHFLGMAQFSMYAWKFADQLIWKWLYMKESDCIWRCVFLCAVCGFSSVQLVSSRCFLYVCDLCWRFTLAVHVGDCNSYLQFILGIHICDSGLLSFFVLSLLSLCG